MSLQESPARGVPAPTLLEWEWGGCCPGIIVRLNEDGVSIRFRESGAIEPGEVPEFVGLLTHVLEVSTREDDDLVPAPFEGDSLEALSGRIRRRRLVKLATNAVRDAVEEAL